jgi:hypothetical protein
MAIPSEDKHIIANPLLNENRQERCQKTKDRDEGPKHLHGHQIAMNGRQGKGLVEWKNRNLRLWRDEE